MDYYKYEVYNPEMEIIDWQVTPGHGLNDARDIIQRIPDVEEIVDIEFDNSEFTRWSYDCSVILSDGTETVYVVSIEGRRNNDG
jgi:hypothetical protein